MGGNYQVTKLGEKLINTSGSYGVNTADAVLILNFFMLTNVLNNVRTLM